MVTQQANTKRSETKAMAKRKRSHSGALTQRALLATMVHREFTLKDSHSTLISAVQKGVFLRAFAAALMKHNHKLLTAILHTVASSAFFFQAVSSLTPEQKIFLNGFCAVCAILFGVLYVSHTNYVLLRMLLVHFETMFFAAEATIFAVGLWGLHCFSLSGFFLGLTATFSGLGLILFDSFPPSVRKDLKWPFMYGLASFCFCLGGLSRGYFDQLCYYRLDVSAWKWNPDTPNVSTISLSSVCLNAGLTLLVLALRTAVIIQFSPGQCVILKSSLLLMESRSEEEKTRVAQRAVEARKQIQAIESRASAPSPITAMATNSNSSQPQARIRSSPKGEELQSPRHSSQSLTASPEHKINVQLCSSYVLKGPKKPPKFHVNELRALWSRCKAYWLKFRRLMTRRPKSKVKPLEISPVSSCQQEANVITIDTAMDEALTTQGQPPYSTPAVVEYPPVETRQQSCEMLSGAGGETATTERGVDHSVMALVAVTPAITFTNEESSITLMSQMCGKRWAAVWYRHRYVSSYLVGFPCFIWFLIYHYLVLWTDLSDHPVAMGATIFATVYLVQIHAFVMNLKLLKLLLSSFDALFLLGEGTFYVVSLWFFQCATLSEMCFMVAYLFGIIFFVVYDSVTVSSRKILRQGYIIGISTTTATLVSAQFGLLKSYCIARADLSTWSLELRDSFHAPNASLLFKAGPELSGQPPGSSTNNELSGLWVQEFVITRGLTVLILMLRLVYNVIKHPHECVLLRSDVRILEVSSCSHFQSSKKDEFAP